jgi:type IV secretory pathway component VirB8
MRVLRTSSILTACYPRAVFAWGDYGEHYKKLESRRNVLWWAVIVALFINIVAGFFVAAVHQ